ncbi:MAG: YbhB/YbcL family Raf kinase inhibitor-like protein [Phreatobacter sp.]|uniref:YbhB/YbcL family Raf kinase inhibitor-like protein n=1 Tax=Phreatobacter sp. TaxID=1966341 RepID=UPI001A629437|nr:YbhB/YbcL family Raf kinase inhibitor-like protein [Phreatobacter sp.]MBL8569559.1 YbhB/YbcL family Raf kinase inhibitor-like protein [Phreatobacter sp.]
MKLVSDTFPDMGFMPDTCAFGLLEPDKSYRWGENRNPHFAWSDLPAGTRSLVMINDDLDVPVRLETFNKEGSVVAREQQRRSLCHWVLVDIDPAGGPIAFGELSEGVTEGGKPGPEATRGMRQGLNEYTDWFRNDARMGGQYFGYDGPCPPWNDERPHRYVFTLYALDIDRLPVEGAFDKSAALAAMQGHVLAEASLTGLYALNPNAVRAL